jgi:hypothetical protein
MTVYDEAMARRAAKTTRRAGVVHDRR